MGRQKGTARTEGSPLRGEVWLADLDPVRGHEQAGRRPVLVVSDESFNRSGAGLVIVLPITSTLRPVPLRVRLFPPEGGLIKVSDVLCEGVRSISKERLLVRLGLVKQDRIAFVEDGLRVLLAL